MAASLREEIRDLRSDLTVASAAAKKMAVEAAAVEKSKWKDRLRVHQISSSNALAKKENKFKREIKKKTKEIDHMRSEKFSQVRNLEKQVTVLRDDISKSSLKQNLLASDIQFQVTKAVRVATQTERQHFSAKKNELENKLDEATKEKNVSRTCR